MICVLCCAPPPSAGNSFECKIKVPSEQSVIMFCSQLVVPWRVLEWLMSSETLTFPLWRQHLHSRGFHSPEPFPHPEKSRGQVSSLQCFFLFWVHEIHINSLDGIPLCEALCWECRIPLKHILKNILVIV